MARKVLISFLGPTSYKECNYVFADKEHQSRFVQSAILKFFCNDWDESDIAYFCLTDTAKDKNWAHPNQNKYDGLSKEIEDLKIENSLQLKIEEISLNEDVTKDNIEKEIWSTFEKIFQTLKNEDKVILDITHSFRYLPMLSFALINYAKFLSDIDILGIYYGAVEVLGDIREIDNKYPNISDRKSPIVDLTSFSLLQDWTVGANNFLTFGNSDILTKLIPKKHKKLSESLSMICNDFTTARGYSIFENKNIEGLKKSLTQLKLDFEGLIAPLIPLIDKIEQKIDKFNNNDINNGFEAVNWCIQHNLIQQGITILQENIISFLVHKQDLDIRKKLNRDLISGSFYILQKNAPFEQWKDECKENEELVNKIIADDLTIKLLENYKNLESYRNDINHAGYLETAMKSSKFKTKLAEIFNTVLEIVK
jgi:CRISPR-associated Csx2 family protein